MKQRHAGLTLIELLVVAAIMTILVAATIPLMQPVVSSRKMREAARGVNTYIAGAQARAVRLKRPVGVLFRPLDVDDPSTAAIETDSRVCVQLLTVEVPPPYAGATASATAQVRITKNSSPGDPSVPTPADPLILLQAKFSNADLYSDLTIRPGDRVQFNNQGLHYEIIGPVATNGTIDTSGGVLNLRVTSLARLPWRIRSTSDSWGSADIPVPFQIWRQATPSARDPYQLPDGIAIDMTVSGEGRGAFSIAPLAIVFSPGGGIDRVYTATGAFARAMSPFYLMLGSIDKARNTNALTAIASPAGEENYRDLDNLWVTITAKSGQVYTSDIAAASAQATATIDSSTGQVTGIVVANPGWGYTAAPNVTLVGGGLNASGATATATLTDGEVTGITLSGTGSGYTEPPQVLITDTVPLNDIIRSREYAMQGDVVGGS